MAHIFEDRILETSTTTGAGDIALNGALPGFKSLASVCAVADTIFYAVWAVDVNGVPTGDFESGVGTYSAVNTLARTAVVRSSNANAAVVFAAGTKYMALTLISSYLPQLAADKTITLPIVQADPNAPAIDFLKIFARKKAGRLFLAAQGPSNWDTSLQAKVGRNKMGWWIPSGNSTAVPGIFGMPALTATGTVTARNVATTNFFTRAQRIGVVSAATAAALCGYRGTAQSTLGVPGTPNMGGFEYIVRFGCSDAAAVAGARQFVGVSAAPAAPANVEPSTLVNAIGVGHGTTDTNLKLFFGGSAAQAPIDLGASFPINTLSADLYELSLFAPPNVNNTVHYRVERLNTGAVAEGVLTAAVPGTQLPANTTLLGIQAWRSNNATALACALDFASFAIEKDD